jgi:hypothetical protein
MSGYLPIQLAYGNIAVYKIVQRSSLNNIPAPKGFNWATVYQISEHGMEQGTVVGQSILYNGTKVICQLNYANHSYPIMEEAIIVTSEFQTVFS